MSVCAHVCVLKGERVCGGYRCYLQGNSLQHANALPCDGTRCAKSISTFGYSQELSLPLSLGVTEKNSSPFRNRPTSHAQRVTQDKWLFFFFLNSLISHLAGGLREGFVWHGRYFYASAEGERLKIIAKGFAYTNNVFFSFFQGEPVFTSAEKCRHNHSVE